MLNFMRLGFKKGKPGFNHWWAQRLSAISLAITSVWLLGTLFQDRPLVYDTARLWFQNPWHYGVCLIFSLSLLQHFYLGLEKIINDYVHDEKVHRVIMRVAMIGGWVAAVGCIGILTALLIR